MLQAINFLSTIWSGQITVCCMHCVCTAYPINILLTKLMWLNDNFAGFWMGASFSMCICEALLFRYQCIVTKYNEVNKSKEEVGIFDYFVSFGRCIAAYVCHFLKVIKFSTSQTFACFFSTYFCILSLRYTTDMVF